MMMRPRGLMSPHALYRSEALSFDGANDYALRGADLTGAANGQAILGSLWVDFNGGNGSVQAIYGAAGIEILVQKNAANQLDVFVENTSGTIVFRRTTTDTYTDASPWLNILFSSDAAAGTGHIYVNDAIPNLGTTTNPGGSPTFDLTSTEWAVGSRTNGAQKLNGCLAELYIAYEFLDLSVAANRRKFISADGRPVRLGDDGSLPTGNQPIVYMPDGNPEDNRGSGGNFTITGALTACSGSPSA